MRGHGPVQLVALGLIAAAGCMSTQTVGDDDSGDPNACNENLLLDGASGSGPTALGPLQLGTTNICMRLDATHNLVRGHFMASTEVETGSTSSFTTALTELDGTMILQGWDVTFGQLDPQSRATLEWAIPAGDVRDVMLHVSARAAATTTIRLALFEPFE